MESQKIEQNENFNVGIYKRNFKIDYSKVKTIEDIVDILESFDFTINWFQKDCPKQFQKIHEKGFLIEITDDKN